MKNVDFQAAKPRLMFFRGNWFCYCKGDVHVFFDKTPKAAYDRWLAWACA